MASSFGPLVSAAKRAASTSQPAEYRLPQQSDQQVGLAAARGAGLGLPRRNCRFRKPHGQAPALAQGGVIGGPIRHSVPLLRDVMAAILVRFEWHGDYSGSEMAAPSYIVHSSPLTTDPCNKVHPRGISRDRSSHLTCMGLSLSRGFGPGVSSGSADCPLGLLTVLCSERERPFFVPSPAIRFPERAEGVKGPKR